VCDSTPPEKRSLLSTTSLFRTTKQAWQPV